MQLRQKNNILHKGAVMKQFLLFACLLTQAENNQQCVVCICEDKNNTIEIQEPQCNTGKHPERQRALCKKEAQSLCTSICNSKNLCLKETVVWQTQTINNSK